MSDTKAVNFELHVAYVGAGGNVGNGEYFYSCHPKIWNVDKTNTPIVFTLSDGTEKRFQIVDVFHSDMNSQITQPIEGINGRSITVTHENKIKALTFFSILVLDNESKSDYPYVNCDPQATNVPQD